MILLSDRNPMLSTHFPRHLIEQPTNVLPIKKDFYTTYAGDDIQLVVQLNDAAAEGRQIELETLLSTPGSIEDIVHFAFRVWNTSTLYSASLKGQTRCVRLLLSKNHDCEAGNHFGTSPLEIAAMRDHAEVVAELLCSSSARITEQVVTAAAQWNSNRSLCAMFASGRLSEEMRGIAWEVAKQKKHVELMDSLARMREMSPVEFSADGMITPALRCLSERKSTGIIFPTFEQWRKALPLLSRSKIKVLRPAKDFKECKELILTAQRRLVETAKVLAFVRVGKDKQPLALQAPKVFSSLNEMLGFIAVAQKPVEDTSIPSPSDLDISAQLDRMVIG